MSITIRPPEEQDIEGIFACLRDYRLHPLGDGSTADPDFPADALLSVRNQIAEIDLEARCFVGVRDGRILGFCCWGWSDRAERHAKTVLISVSESARGLGVGSLLQHARTDDMWAAGAEEIHTWSDDPRSIAWYERHFGYRLAGWEPIRHSLHRFRWRERTWWALHRGFPERDRLAHLVLARSAVANQNKENQ
ncbi:MAG TPA: GNAT family N-acetyltransferase [Gemmatimonadaceae bacterium]